MGCPDCMGQLMDESESVLRRKEKVKVRMDDHQPSPIEGCFPDRVFIWRESRESFSWVRPFWHICDSEGETRSSERKRERERER